MKLSCKDFSDFLLDYDSGELDAAERARFDQHMIDCPPCLTYLETYRETIRLGKRSLCDDDAPPADAPEELVQAILAARKSRP